MRQMTCHYLQIRGILERLVARTGDVTMGLGTVAHSISPYDEGVQGPERGPRIVWQS